MDPGLLAILRCPACRGAGLGRSRGAVTCAACGVAFARAGGYVDMMTGDGAPAASTAEQRFMESELIARLYERTWRPGFVRAVAGRGASASTGGFQGEFFIHKNCLAMDDRDGPWLDLSCGSGVFARAMAAAAPSALTVGLDISRAMLEVAARRAKGYANAAFVRADAHELPLIDACIGGVNNAGALHAYHDPERVFREVMRVLRPGGVYVGSTFSAARSVVGRVAARAAGIRRFDPRELGAWLSRIGFADYDDIELGGAFIFRARKP